MASWTRMTLQPSCQPPAIVEERVLPDPATTSMSVGRATPRRSSRSAKRDRAVTVNRDARLTWKTRHRCPGFISERAGDRIVVVMNEMMTQWAWLYLLAWQPAWVSGCLARRCG